MKNAQNVQHLPMSDLGRSLFETAAAMHHARKLDLAVPALPLDETGPVDVQSIEAIVHLIENDPFRFAVRYLNLEFHMREFEPRLTRVEETCSRLRANEAV